jgi:hypothetical protein
VNASWFQINQEFRLESRISASWQVHQRHRFSLGYGNHSQIGKLDYPNRILNRMRAHHFVFGYDWSATENLRLKIESYYQKLYHVPVVEGTSYSMINFLSNWTFDKALVNGGTGTNTGLDITVERFLKDGIYYMLTGSV